MVSPRKSRKKSLCFSSTTTSMPARASRKPSIIPAGPPPAMQQRAVMSAMLFGGERRHVGGYRRTLRARHRLRPPAMFPLAEQRLQLRHDRVGEQAGVVLGELLAHVAEL